MRSSPEYRTFEELVSFLEKSDKKYDMQLIKKAFDYAKKAHGKQKRVSGVDYILHPVSVAYILAELGMDTQSIAAALLHDVLEDTSAGVDEIKNEFGSEIAKLVDGVTKFKIIDSTEEEQQIISVRKMLVAMSQDIRVIIIKLADRLNNMRTIACMPDKKRIKKSIENMELFVPIAHRLGISSVKEELEDLSLKYIDPEAYKKIEDSLKLKENDREKLLNNIKTKILKKIAPIFPKVHIEGRVKSINGIYNKVFLKGRTMEEVYDIYAIRVIVNTINECYNVLGIIHEMFNPIPNRFKDYISIPKPNMYQSLHTTVLSQEGIPFEFQIRTWDMHKTAEYGVAAHWKYKLNPLENKDALEKYLSWVKNIVDYHGDNEDLNDIVGNIKLDLAPEEVFALTPKGEAISLPMGATVIDFAYAIHTEIGHRMIGAKVDKRIVPITHKLKTGEIVEIIAAKETGRGPSRDWLKIVKTSEARNKIRQWFKKEKRSDNIVEGKIALERELKRNGLFLSSDEIKMSIEPFLRRKNYHALDDLYAAIGYGGVKLQNIVSAVKEQYLKNVDVSNTKPLSDDHNKRDKEEESQIKLDGVENCLYRLSRCCYPIPYDDIIGFVTRGSGVSIHRCSCKNVPKIISKDNQPERWIKATWAGKFKGSFVASLEILSENNILPELTMQLNHLKIKISSISSRSIENEKTITILDIVVNGTDQLNAVITTLSQIVGIIYVKRPN